MGRKMIETQKPRPQCISCETRPAMPSRKNRAGIQLYFKFCASCARKAYGKQKIPYRKSKKPHCERCGFVAADKSQLDVHHRDGNNKNNDPGNLETLCANCHRLHHLGPSSGAFSLSEQPTPEALEPLD